MNNSVMIFENPSQFGMEETIQKITTAAEVAGWKIPVIHDLQETLKKNNIDVLPVKVMELCKPAYSGKLLALDNERVISSLMPCRISVYEKSDGKVYVSRINAGLLSNFLGGLFAEVMGQASEDLEEIIQPVL